MVQQELLERNGDDDIGFYTFDCRLCGDGQGTARVVSVQFNHGSGEVIDRGISYALAISDHLRAAIFTEKTDVVISALEQAHAHYAHSHG